MNKGMNMNTNDTWAALEVFGHARISVDEVDAAAMDVWNVTYEVACRWIRNRLNFEADLEGVSLRINSLPDGHLDVYLRKFT
jgi:hypothetical protein